MFKEWHVIDFNTSFSPEEMNEFYTSPMKYLLAVNLSPDNIVAWKEADYESYLSYLQRKDARGI